MTVNSETLKYGLSQKEIESICTIFNRYSEIDRVILYGSRAKGNFRRNSDLDFVLEGNDLTLKTLMRIEREIDDLLLPYKTDLAILHKIENKDLLDHIQRVGVTFYRKD